MKSSPRNQSMMACSTTIDLKTLAPLKSTISKSWLITTISYPAISQASSIKSKDTRSLLPKSLYTNKGSWALKSQIAMLVGSIWWRALLSTLMGSMRSRRPKKCQSWKIKWSSQSLLRGTKSQEIIWNKNKPIYEFKNRLRKRLKFWT